MKHGHGYPVGAKHGHGYPVGALAVPHGWLGSSTRTWDAVDIRSSQAQALSLLDPNEVN